jgi:hypothetical protein
MDERKLTSWEEFEAEIEQWEGKPKHVQPLFRGQRKSEWPLETTLERYGAVDYSGKEYFRNITSARRKIETVTGKKWEFSEEFKEGDSYMAAPQGYEFMVFLRHHGFPSPLLDWSRSPYIAAFFAFHRAEPKHGEFVALFEYVEDTGFGKGISPDEATIRTCGPWISTDKRHFLQQSEYTVCRKQVRRPNGNDEVNYARHEEALARGEPDQDILTKYLVPAGERERVLRKLQLMNITSYSLFESIESLVEIIASDVIEL